MEVRKAVPGDVVTMTCIGSLTYVWGHPDNDRSVKQAVGWDAMALVIGQGAITLDAHVTLGGMLLCMFADDRLIWLHTYDVLVVPTST